MRVEIVLNSERKTTYTAKEVMETIGIYKPVSYVNNVRIITIKTSKELHSYYVNSSAGIFQPFQPDVWAEKEFIPVEEEVTVTFKG